VVWTAICIEGGDAGDCGLRWRGEWAKMIETEIDCSHGSTSELRNVMATSANLVIEFDAGSADFNFALSDREGIRHDIESSPCGTWLVESYRTAS
jgi:hypothetical protein